MMDLELQLLGRFLVQRPMKRRRKKSTCISPTYSLRSCFEMLILNKHLSWVLKKNSRKTSCRSVNIFQKIFKLRRLKLFKKRMGHPHKFIEFVKKKKEKKKISGDYVKY